MGYAAGQSPYVRSASGELVSSALYRSQLVRIELLRRRCLVPQDWHFCQPEPALFWFRRGFNRFYGHVDGRLIQRRFVGQLQLSFIPDGTQIEAKIDLEQTSDLVAVFFNPRLMEEQLGSRLDTFKMAFQHPGLMAGLDEICRELPSPGTAFGLLVDGWAIQSVARMARAYHSLNLNEIREFRGGLTGPHLQRVKNYVQENIDQTITLESLADAAGLSTRHFLRAFRETMQITPHKYVVSQRIDLAKDLLLRSRDSITEIALRCGYPNAQHFATSFRKEVGMTPSAYKAVS